MNPNTAIQIQNLSKQYRLGLVGTGTLAHDLNRWWTMNIQGKEDPYLKVGEVNVRESKGQSDYVWALRDINLEIQQGDVVGIIGKNGAGKSTLLKILSRVTKPTTGTIQYRGRIASLLEVGTGFHPEMTGRENIYMNGSIMGMTRHEITRKLDEIVAFAGVERYIDTPVKRYSSGMTVRLGFAVAAHLEPDILVVDEVLAVGDAEFQKKAIGKMQDVSQQGGRTVLFVSHNMGAVQSLCSRGIFLSDGLISKTGGILDVIQSYLNVAINDSQMDLLNRIDRKGLGRLIFKKMYLVDSSDRIINKIQVGEDFILKIELLNKGERFFRKIRIDLGLNDGFNNRIAWLSSSLTKDLILNSSNDIFNIQMIIKNLPFMPGNYSLTANLIADDNPEDWIPFTLSFQILEGLFFSSGKLPPQQQGYFLLEHSFNVLN